jgi:hypothetical protein
MNEYIESTMGRIHVCVLCCFLVTIRGLVGLSIGTRFVWSSSRSYAASRVRSNLMRASLHRKIQTRCSGETVRITRLEA